MACGTIKRYGPAYLAAAAADILSQSDATKFIEIRRIHLNNTQTSSSTFTLFIGASGGSSAGTALYTTKLIPSNDVFIDWRLLKLLSTEYLTGFCPTGANRVTIEIEYYERPV